MRTKIGLHVFVTVLWSCTASLLTNSAEVDWLLAPAEFRAEFQSPKESSGRFTLSNGIASRTFLLKEPVAATIGLSCGGQNLFRSVNSEAIVTINGKRYEVGGLVGQPNHAYLRDTWLNEMKPTP